MSATEGYPSYPPTAPAFPAFDAGPVLSSEPRGGAGGSDTRPPIHATARRPRRAATWILAALLLLSLAACGYLTVLARSWSERAAQLDQVIADQSARITATEEELAISQSELKETSDQLATAQQRITELANEKAQAGDDQAATAQLLDYQQRVSTAAGQVASALGECISGQKNLIGYLKDPSRYDPASLATYQSQVEEFCNQAVQANQTLQQELTK